MNDEIQKEIEKISIQIINLANKQDMGIYEIKKLCEQIQIDIYSRAKFKKID